MADTLSQSFPHKGDEVIKIGNALTVNWVSSDVDVVNIFFIKNFGYPDDPGYEKIHVTRVPTYNGTNSYTFSINDSMYSDQYYLCQIVIESAIDSAVFVASTPQFQVIKGI